ncbi:hypothetical protein Tco_0828050 [Tanacetum coccineum]
MYADLKYVESIENEIDELESDKFHSLSDLDAHAELQCLYDHKVKKCECLAQKLSKQTESVICKEKASNVFLKEHEQYFEIQDLKAQLQDKDIAIRKPPLKPIRNQPVVGKPTVYKSERSQLPRHRIASQVGVSHDLTKPVTPHSWPQVRKSSFAKPYDVNAPGPSRNSPKHVSFQSPRESVGSNDMVHNYYLEEAKKKAQLQKDKALNTKPSVQQSAILPNTANGNKSKPGNFNQQPRNWPPSMSSRVSNRTVNTKKPTRNQKTFLKSKDFLEVNSRVSTQKKDAQSHKTTKRYIPVEKKSDSKNHGRQIPIGQRFSPNKSSNVYLKTMPPISGLTWKPTSRIFTQVGLKWIPIRKSVETRYNTNDSASPLGKETHNPKTIICANSSCLSAGFIKRWRWRHLIPAESDSLPHAHTQATKTYYKHQDSRIKKAQELNTKTSANFDIQDLP